MLRAFNAHGRQEHEAASEEVFRSRILAGEKLQDIPDEEDKRAFARFVLPKIIEHAADADLMQSILDWLDAEQERHS